MRPFTRPGEVRAVPGTVLFSGAVTGVWTAGAVAETRFRLLPFFFPALVRSARCTFAFSGFADSGTTPIAASSTVTLSSWLALRRGDTASDFYGNTVRA
jgi:hypothetical protein